MHVGQGSEENKMANPDPTLQLAIVFESADLVAVGIAKAALEEAGIQFAVLEDARTGYGFSPILNPVYRLQVAQACEDNAVELMEGLTGAVNQSR
jgi:hypothetical protein